MARHKEFDEDQALDTCVDTFWSGSYAATSTQDLCDATGLSRSSLYNAFHGKPEVYRRALARYADRRAAARATYLEQGGSGREALELLIRDNLDEQWSADGRRTCLVINAATEVDLDDEAVLALLRRDVDAIRDEIAQLVARGQADGSITNRLPAADLALLIHATTNGLQVAARVDPDRARQHRVVDAVLAVLGD